ncbi:Cytosine deaminase [Phytophthora cinnamomi]|uniref:Cytosine deaminase n=1 Tax=Phytophthora cinnamomi TaxID=4785 RepID=UPI00355A39F3|nr:Cytosine deaminase [Phytophthora cinnamomi]
MELQKDVEALDRVLFRLASVDDERMLQVLQSLLPQLLPLFPRSLATPLEQQLKDKLLQVVGHIKTRLQALTRPALPLDALCHVLQQPELSVFSHNLALLFIELGFDAASTEQRTTVLAAVVKRLASFSGTQQEAFFRLLVRALPVSAAAIFPGLKSVTGDGEGQEGGESLTGDAEEPYEGDADVDVVLDFLLDLVLYEPPSSTNADATVYGLMTPRVERLQRVKVVELTREALYERQQHVLKLVKEMEVPTRHKIPVYLAGSASFHHAVKAFSEEQLSRVLKYEEKEVEDADAMRRLMTLMLGSQIAQTSGAFEGADAVLLANRTRLADPSILQALTILSVSEAATNILPVMLQLLCQLMFGTEPSRPPNVDNKIKLATVRLCQWTFHHCQLTLLEGLLGPVLFPTLLRLLMNPHAESEASSAEFVREFRQGVYESLAVLGTRTPTLVSSSEQAFQVLLVRCLSEEEQRTGAGANALKAFTSLAGAYAVAAAPEVRTKVKDELVALLNGSKLFEPTKNYARVRAAIAAWCAELLASESAPKDDITMRFAVLRLGTSSDEDTRRLSDKALFAQPLPSTSTLAKSLQANFPQKDLKKGLHDFGAAEGCVRFCVEIMKASLENPSLENVNDRRSIVEYILLTLLSPAEHKAPTSATATSVFETAASAAMEVSSFDPKSLPFELRKCNGAELLLRRVLIPYVGAKTAAENDQYGDEESRYGGASGGNSTEGTDSTMTATSGLSDGLVIQSYCRAAAYLCPLVDAPTVREYVRTGIFAFNIFSKSGSSKTSSPSSSPRNHSDDEAMTNEEEDTQSKAHQVYTSRFLLISALATKELVKKVPPIADADTVVGNDLRNSWYSTNVFPAAFVGQFAATDALKSSWMAVLDELPPTVLYSSSSLDAVLHAIALLLAHPAWDTRRQAARALQAIFASATYRSRLTTEQIAHIWQELIDAVPGRLWRGKGVILESIVALAAVKLEAKTTDRDWVQKLSLLLIDECARAWKNHDLTYLESAIVNLGKFSASIPVEQSELRASNVRSLRSAFSEWMAQSEAETPDSAKVLPPLLIKCIFEALALMWPLVTAEQAAINSGHADTALGAIVWLCASVESPNLAAWSTRKAIFQTLTAVADRAPVSALAGGKNSAVERMVETCCGAFGVADGKYSMVRVAAAAALAALLKRAAEDANVALTLVVQRERVSAAVQTLSTSEEASEQQAAFNLKTQLTRDSYT